ITSLVLKEKNNTPSLSPAKKPPVFSPRLAAARTQPPANWARRPLLLPDPALSLLPCSSSSRTPPASEGATLPGPPHSTGPPSCSHRFQGTFLNTR
uniref:Uncharacterized protein n=1 Tax=Oryza punctata TaxID=4537 RepID=A0A0E0LUG1_ORYPU